MSSPTYKNYLNLSAFVLIGFASLMMNDGPNDQWMEGLNIREFFRKYEDGVMTPSEPFFFFSQLIVMALAIFTVVQFLPAYRAHAMVEVGVEEWFFGSMVCEIVAIALVGQDRNEAGFVRYLFSTIFVGASVGCLWKILDNQANRVQSDESAEEYWLLRFPFSLNMGWTIVLFIMSFNMLFNGEGGEDNGVARAFKIIFALLSLGAYAGISIKTLFFSADKPNYVIPSVLSIALIAIATNMEIEGGDQDGGFALSMDLVLLVLTSILAFLTPAAIIYTAYMNEIKNAAPKTEDEASSEYEGAELTDKPIPMV
jgi:hypothetical protein